VDQHAHRRIRVTVDVERRPPTKAERVAQQRAIAATPNALEKSIESVWLSRMRISEPDQPLGGAGVSFSIGTDDERLGRIIASIRSEVSVESTRQLAREQVPIDLRFAELVGTDELPSRRELATSTAALLGLSEPSLHATEALLVDVVLLAHGWYYNPYADAESTTVGHSIGSRAKSELSASDFAAALQDLGLDDEVALWSAAAGLVKHMGFRVW